MRRVVLALLLIAAGMAAMPSMTRADDRVQVKKSEAHVRFPLFVDFHLEGTTDIPLLGVSLEFSTPEARYGDYTRSIRVLDDPGDTFKADWTWQTQGNPSLPPGALVRYQWVFATSSGRIESDAKEFRIEDDRFDFKRLPGKGVVLAYYGDDDAAAKQMVGYAEQGLQRIANDMDLVPTGTVTLVIYDSTEAMMGAVPTAPSWAGGVAFPEFDTVVIAIPPDSGDWARRSITHELSHQVTYQLTFEPTLGSQVPPWLNEGLAVVAEQAPDEGRAELMRKAVETNTVPSLRNLSASFPDQPHLAGLDYAASESAVRFLFDKYGAPKMKALLAAYKSGKTTNEAIEEAYGLSQDEMEDEWRVSLGLDAINRPAPQTATAVPTIDSPSLQPRPRRDEGTDPLELPAVRIAIIALAGAGAFLLVTFAVSMVLRRD